jgi:hypothetical protein
VIGLKSLPRASLKKALLDSPSLLAVQNDVAAVADAMGAFYECR